MRVLFIGGAFDRLRAHLSRTPLTLTIRGQVYERVDDPDTGEALGAYIARPSA